MSLFLSTGVCRARSWTVLLSTGVSWPGRWGLSSTVLKGWHKEKLVFVFLIITYFYCFLYSYYLFYLSTVSLSVTRSYVLQGLYISCETHILPPPLSNPYFFPKFYRFPRSAKAFKKIAAVEGDRAPSGDFSRLNGAFWCPKNQCFGSGSGSVWIRIIWSDPDPYQETIDMDPGSVKN